MLASTRSALLLEAESRLSEYQGRIRLLEKSLEEKTSLLKQHEQSATTEKHDRHEDNILSVSMPLELEIAIPCSSLAFH